MRIIDYFNCFALFVYIVIVICCLLRRPHFLTRPMQGELAGKWEGVLFFLLLTVGIILRFYRLAVLPEGMHQDEASNAYEAFCLANYGIDRNGYRYPVYPITWGSGGGSPVLIYLLSVIFRFAKPSVFLYRSVFAAFGSLTLVLFYLFLRKIYDNKTALMGMGALALMPWHIMLSRWGLDSNTIPFWCMLILVLFLYANETKKTALYLLTACFCGVILYCYGSATFVMPFFVLFACGYSLWTGRLTLRQLIFCGIAFLVAVFPLAVFYFINVFDFPAILTPYFSVPRFTGSHTASVFVSLNSSLPSQLWNNFLHLLQMLTVGVTDDVLWNYVPGYYTLYLFTFPITFLGFAGAFRDAAHSIRRKENSGNVLMCCMAVAAFLFALMLKQNINRMVFIFLPLIYFFVTGLTMIAQWSRYGVAAAALLFTMGSVSFTHDYFLEYGPLTSHLFMKGYGDATAYADSIRGEDATIYSTYDTLASPFITALLYTETSPYDYLETAVFKSEEAEFRVAVSFTHFVFGLPEDIMEDRYRNDILIIAQGEKEKFALEEYAVTDFGNFAVLSVREAFPAP